MFDIVISPITELWSAQLHLVTKSSEKFTEIVAKYFFKKPISIVSEADRIPHTRYLKQGYTIILSPSPPTILTSQLLTAMCLAMAPYHSCITQ